MLSVVLTDGEVGRAPVGDGSAQIVSARVTIARVYLNGEGGAQRTLLLDDEETVDLLALDAKAATLVERAKIPAGRYQGLQIVVSGAYLEVADGTGASHIYASSPTYAALPEGSAVAGQLLLPAANGAALDVAIADGLDFAAGDQAIHLTFDVSASFAAQAALEGRWVLSPAVSGRSVR